MARQACAFYKIIVELRRLLSVKKHLSSKRPPDTFQNFEADL